MISFDPSQPTNARPGSSLKIEILRARNERGLPLFMPGDVYSHAASVASHRVKVKGLHTDVIANAIAARDESKNRDDQTVEA